MKDWVREGLTRRRGGSRRREASTEEANEKLVYAVKFAIGMTVCLSALEVAHMAFMHVWNSEIFAVITALCGTVTGIFVGQKA